jgi:hypothetical protein
MALWEMMSSMYGHKWTSAYGVEDSNNVWLACLREISPDQIRQGIKRCNDLFLEWPPSAPEFRRMCLGLDKSDDPEHVAIAGIHKVFPPLLENKTAQENARKVGAAELSKLKELF